MTAHDRDLLRLNCDDSSGLSACDIESHHWCDDEGCEVRAVSAEVTSAQIRVGLVTAITGLLISTACVLAIVGIWVHSYLTGQPMPDIPLIISSIATATFAAGTITTLKIPKKAKLKLMSKE